MTERSREPARPQNRPSSDPSTNTPLNPSSPPIRVVWGEESKDEMGSISLMAVARKQTDFAPLQSDLAGRRNRLAKETMRADPALAMKILRLLAE